MHTTHKERKSSKKKEMIIITTTLQAHLSIRIYCDDNTHPPIACFHKIALVDSRVVWAAITVFRFTVLDGKAQNIFKLMILWYNQQ